MGRLGAEPDASDMFAGIFAFKCSRAEEIFNMLQEVMHNHSISVVEEAVLEPPQQAAHTPAGTHTPHTPAIHLGLAFIPPSASCPVLEQRWDTRCRPFPTG